MSYNPPLVPRRTAPPTPSGYSPGGAPPPQPSRSNRPSLTSQPQRKAPGVPTQQQQFSTSPQPTRTPTAQSTPSDEPGVWGNITQGFSSWWGSSPTPEQQKTNRAELIPAPAPKTVVNPHDPKWNQLQTNSAQQQQYYSNIASQSSNHLQNALQSAQTSEQIGMATLDTLSEQADGIDRINRDVESMHLQLDRGERQIKAIGLAGAAKNAIKGDSAHKQNRAVYNAYHNQTANDIQLDTSHTRSYGCGLPVTTAPQKKANTDAGQALKDKLAEQDRQLAALSGSLGNLQAIGGTMNTELKKQNATLDKMNARTEQAIHRTHDASYKMQRLM